MKRIKFYLTYTLYFIVTIHKRNEYLKALEKGYDCYKSNDDSYVLYGSATMYYFDKSKPPTRRYLTYKEYKGLYYPQTANH